jgi:8-oxo-dGTP pyrophosphatase MutT (NUDIX family)
MVLGSQLAQWKPNLHPRDSHGRFRDTWKIPEGAARAIESLLRRFDNVDFTSNGHAAYYLDRTAKRGGVYDDKQKKALEYFLSPEGNTRIQRELRSGKNAEGLKGYPPEIATLRGMMRPLEEDLLLTRVVGPDAFGLPPERIHEVEEWTGKQFDDLGFSPYNIGTPYPVDGPHITISAMVPKGTPAIIVGDGYGTVILDIEQPARAVRFSSDGRGGHYMYTAVTPRTKGNSEAPRALGKELTPREKREDLAVPATPEEMARRGLDSEGNPLPQPAKALPPAGTPAPGEVGRPAHTPAPTAPPGEPGPGPAAEIQAEGRKIPVGAGGVPDTEESAPTKITPRKSAQVEDPEAARLRIQQQRLEREQARLEQQQARAMRLQELADRKQARIDATEARALARLERDNERLRADNERLARGEAPTATTPAPAPVKKATRAAKKAATPVAPTPEKVAPAAAKKTPTSRGGTTTRGMTEAQKSAMVSADERLAGQPPRNDEEARIRKVADQVRAERAGAPQPAKATKKAVPSPATKAAGRPAKAPTLTAAEVVDLQNMDAMPHNSDWSIPTDQAARRRTESLVKKGYLRYLGNGKVEMTPEGRERARSEPLSPKSWEAKGLVPANPARKEAVSKASPAAPIEIVPEAAPEAPPAPAKKAPGAKAPTATARRQAAARGMEISDRATAADVQRARDWDEKPETRPKIATPNKYENFDESRAVRHEPQPEEKTGAIVVEPADHTTVLTDKELPASWGPGATEEMHGTWVRVPEPGSDTEYYGSDYNLWLDMHERVPGTKDRWRKVAGVDAYQIQPGEDHPPITTIKPDGTRETGKARIPQPGEWVFRNKNGEVQVTTDEKFRRLYQMPPATEVAKKAAPEKIATKRLSAADVSKLNAEETVQALHDGRIGRVTAARHIRSLGDDEKTRTLADTVEAGRISPALAPVKKQGAPGKVSTEAGGEVQQRMDARLAKQVDRARKAAGKKTITKAPPAKPWNLSPSQQRDVDNLTPAQRSEYRLVRANGSSHEKALATAHQIPRKAAVPRAPQTMGEERAARRARKAGAPKGPAAKAASEEAVRSAKATNARVAAEQAKADAAAKVVTDGLLERAGVKESDLSELDRTGLDVIGLQLADGRISRNEAARRLRTERDSPLNKIADAIQPRHGAKRIQAALAETGTRKSAKEILPSYEALTDADIAEATPEQRAELIKGLDGVRNRLAFNDHESRDRAGAIGRRLRRAGPTKSVSAKKVAAPAEAPEVALAKKVFGGRNGKRQLELLATIDKGDYPGRGMRDVEDLGGLKSLGLIEEHGKSPHGWRLTDQGHAVLDDMIAPNPAFDRDSVLARLRESGNSRDPMSREEAAQLLEGATRTDLQGMAKSLNIPRWYSIKAADLKREVVDATVGRRLDSIATRGFRGNRPDELPIEGERLPAKAAKAVAPTVTKAKLMERARAAGIRGRSSMTTEQLQEALTRPAVSKAIRPAPSRVEPAAPKAPAGPRTASRAKKVPVKAPRRRTLQENLDLLKAATTPEEADAALDKLSEDMLWHIRQDVGVAVTPQGSSWTRAHSRRAIVGKLFPESAPAPVKKAPSAAVAKKAIPAAAQPGTPTRAENLQVGMIVEPDASPGSMLRELIGTGKITDIQRTGLNGYLVSIAWGDGKGAPQLTRYDRNDTINISSPEAPAAVKKAAPTAPAAPGERTGSQLVTRARQIDTVGKRSAYTRKYNKMTREEFDTLPENEREDILFNLRRIEEINDPYTFRDSMGSLVRGGTHPHTAEARRSIKRFTEAKRAPEVKLTPEQVADRILALDPTDKDHDRLVANLLRGRGKPELQRIGAKMPSEDFGGHLTIDKMQQRILRASKARGKAPEEPRAPRAKTLGARPANTGDRQIFDSFGDEKNKGLVKARAAEILGEGKLTPAASWRQAIDEYRSTRAKEIAIDTGDSKVKLEVRRRPGQAGYHIVRTEETPDGRRESGIGGSHGTYGSAREAALKLAPEIKPNPLEPRPDSPNAGAEIGDRRELKGGHIVREVMPGTTSPRWNVRDNDGQDYGYVDFPEQAQKILDREHAARAESSRKPTKGPAPTTASEVAGWRRRADAGAVRPEAREDFLKAIDAFNDGDFDKASSLFLAARRKQFDSRGSNDFIDRVRLRVSDLHEARLEKLRRENPSNKSPEGLPHLRGPSPRDFGNFPPTPDGAWEMRERDRNALGNTNAMVARNPDDLQPGQVVPYLGDRHSWATLLKENKDGTWQVQEFGNQYSRKASTQSIKDAVARNAAERSWRENGGSYPPDPEAQTKVKRNINSRTLADFNGHLDAREERNKRDQKSGFFGGSDTDRERDAKYLGQIAERARNDAETADQDQLPEDATKFRELADRADRIAAELRAIPTAHEKTARDQNAARERAVAATPELYRSALERYPHAPSQDVLREMQAQDWKFIASGGPGMYTFESPDGTRGVTMLTPSREGDHKLVFIQRNRGGRPSYKAVKEYVIGEGGQSKQERPVKVTKAGAKKATKAVEPAGTVRSEGYTPAANVHVRVVADGNGGYIGQRQSRASGEWSDDPSLGTSDTIKGITSRFSRNQWRAPLAERAAGARERNETRVVNGIDIPDYEPRWEHTPAELRQQLELQTAEDRAKTLAQIKRGQAIEDESKLVAYLKRLPGDDVYRIALRGGIAKRDMIQDDDSKATFIGRIVAARRRRVAEGEAPSIAKKAIPAEATQRAKEAVTTGSTPEAAAPVAPAPRPGAAPKLPPPTRKGLHQIKLPDGTMAERTSKTRDYTHAAVITKDNQRAAERDDRMAAKREEAAAAYREALASGDWSKLTRKSAGGNSYHTDYRAVYKDPQKSSIDPEISFPSMSDKDLGADIAYVQKLARADRPYKYYGSDPDIQQAAEAGDLEAFRAARAKRALADNAAAAKRDRDDAERLRTLPEKEYFISRWSGSASGAQAGVNEYRDNGGVYQGRVVEVGDDLSGGQETAGTRSGISHRAAGPAKALPAKKAAVPEAPVAKATPSRVSPTKERGSSPYEPIDVAQIARDAGLDMETDASLIKDVQDLFDNKGPDHVGNNPSAGQIAKHIKDRIGGAAGPFYRAIVREQVGDTKRPGETDGEYQLRRLKNQQEVDALRTEARRKMAFADAVAKIRRRRIGSTRGPAKRAPRPIADPSKRAKAWGAEHGYSGNTGGWIYKEDPQTGFKPTGIQGWDVFYKQHQAAIDKWEADRLRGPGSDQHITQREGRDITPSASRVEAPEAPSRPLNSKELAERSSVGEIVSGFDDGSVGKRTATNALRLKADGYRAEANGAPAQTRTALIALADQADAAADDVEGRESPSVAQRAERLLGRPTVTPGATGTGRMTEAERAAFLNRVDQLEASDPGWPRTAADRQMQRDAEEMRAARRSTDTAAKKAAAQRIAANPPRVGKKATPASMTRAMRFEERLPAGTPEGQEGALIRAAMKDIQEGRPTTQITKDLRDRAEALRIRSEAFPDGEEPVIGENQRLRDLAARYDAAADAVGKRGPAAGKVPASELQPQTKILVSKTSDGRWVPATKKTGATQVTITGVERPKVRGKERFVFTGRTADGQTIEIGNARSTAAGVTPSQRFLLHVEKPAKATKATKATKKAAPEATAPEKPTITRQAKKAPAVKKIASTTAQAPKQVPLTQLRQQAKDAKIPGYSRMARPELERQLANRSTTPEAPGLSGPSVTALKRLSTGGGGGVRGKGLPADAFRPNEDIEGLRSLGLVELADTPSDEPQRYRITEQGERAIDLTNGVGVPAKKVSAPVAKKVAAAAPTKQLSANQIRALTDAQVARAVESGQLSPEKAAQTLRRRAATVGDDKRATRLRSMADGFEGAPAKKAVTPAASRLEPTAPGKLTDRATLARLTPKDFGEDGQVFLDEADPEVSRIVRRAFDMDQNVKMADGSTQRISFKVDNDASVLYQGRDGNLVIRAEGQMRDADGNLVGSFRRELTPATGRVHNDSFALDPKLQQKGLATQFNDQQDKVLADQGFTRVTISPAFNGGLASARRGFGWRSDRAAPAGDVPTRIGEAMQKVTPEERDVLSGWLDRFVDADPAHWPTPREISSQGPLGRSIMNKSSWSGEKRLTPSREVRPSASRTEARATKAVAKKAAPATEGSISERADIKEVLDRLPENDQDQIRRMLSGGYGVSQRRPSQATALRQQAQFKRDSAESALRVNPALARVRDRHDRDMAIADHYDRVADLIYPKPGTRPSRKKLPDVNQTTLEHDVHAAVPIAGSSPASDIVTRAMDLGDNDNAPSLRERATRLRADAKRLHAAGRLRRNAKDGDTRAQGLREVAAGKELERAADAFDARADRLPAAVVEKQVAREARRTQLFDEREQARLDRRKAQANRAGITGEEADRFAESHQTMTQWRQSQTAAKALPAKAVAPAAKKAVAPAKKTAPAAPKQVPLTDLRKQAAARKIPGASRMTRARLEEELAKPEESRTKEAVEKSLGVRDVVDGEAVIVHKDSPAADLRDVFKDATPEHVRDAARQLGLGELEGDTPEELFQSAIKKMIENRLEELRTGKPDAKVARAQRAEDRRIAQELKASERNKEFGPGGPKYIDLRQVARDAGLSETQIKDLARYIDSAQAELNDGKTPGNVSGHTDARSGQVRFRHGLRLMVDGLRKTATIAQGDWGRREGDGLDDLWEERAKARALTEADANALEKLASALNKVRRPTVARPTKAAKAVSTPVKKAAPGRVSEPSVTALERLSAGGGGSVRGKGLPADAFRPEEDIEGLRDLGLVERLDRPEGVRYRITSAGERAIDDAQVTTGRPKNIIPEKATDAGKSVLAPPKGSFDLPDDLGRSGDGFLPSGFWGHYGAAGVLIRADDNGEKKFLLVRRGPGIHRPGQWQLPGGALHEKENPYQGAARETIEEVKAPKSYLTKMRPVGEHIFEHKPSGWKYTTIAADADEPFDAKVDGWESDDAKWFTADEIRGMRDRGELVPNLDKAIVPIINAYDSPSAAKAPTPTKTPAIKTAAKSIPSAPTIRARLLELETAKERRDYLDSLGLDQAESRRLARDLGVKGQDRATDARARDAIVRNFESEAEINADSEAKAAALQDRVRQEESKKLDAKFREPKTVRYGEDLVKHDDDGELDLKLIDKLLSYDRERPVTVAALREAMGGDRDAQNRALYRLANNGTGIDIKEAPEGEDRVDSDATFRFGGQDVDALTFDRAELKRLRPRIEAMRASRPSDGPEATNRGAISAVTTHMEPRPVGVDPDTGMSRLDTEAKTVFANDPGWSPEEQAKVDRALRFWRSSTYKKISPFLRKGEGDGKIQLAEGFGQPRVTEDIMDDHVRPIDRAMEVSPLKKPVVLWRGGTIGAETELPEGNLVGREFDDPGFVATSAKESVASHFAVGDENGLMRLHVPEGIGAIGLSPWPGPDEDRHNDEAEVLLQRGLHFKVIGDTVEQRGFTERWRRDPETGTEKMVKEPRMVRVLDVEVSRPAGGAPEKPKPAKKADLPLLSGDGTAPSPADAATAAKKAVSAKKVTAKKGAPAKKITIPEKKAPAKELPDGPQVLTNTPTKDPFRGGWHPRERPLADEPIHAPNGGADQGLVHMDSVMGSLWEDLYGDDRTPNSFINEVAKLGEGLSPYRGGESDSIDKLIPKLRELATRAPDKGVAARITKAADDLEAPHTPVPDLPDDTPEPLRKFIEEMNKNAMARRTGDFHMYHNVDESLVQRTAKLFHDVASGDSVTSPRDADTKLRKIIYAYHESTDGEYQLRDLYGKSKVDDEIRRWAREAYRARQAKGTETVTPAKKTVSERTLVRERSGGGPSAPTKVAVKKAAPAKKVTVPKKAATPVEAGDGLDSMSDTDLRDLAEEWSVGGRQRADREALIQKLRLKGARKPLPTKATQEMDRGDFSGLRRLSGTASSGVYEGPDGTRWKVQQVTDRRAAERMLGSTLHREAGIDVPEVRRGRNAPGLRKGTLIAVEMGHPGEEASIDDLFDDLTPEKTQESVRRLLRIQRADLLAREAGYEEGHWDERRKGIGFRRQKFIADHRGQAVRPHTGHKVGKDLSRDKDLGPSVMGDVKADPTAKRDYYGFYETIPDGGDAAALGIADRQGFADLPQVVTPEEFDRLKEQGTIGHVLYRGNKGGPYGLTAPELHQQYREGPYRVGQGLYGNGTYMAYHRGLASDPDYASDEPGSVQRYGLRKGAKIIGIEDLRKEYDRYLKGIGKDEDERYLYGDIGRFAMARGYDAVEIPKGTSPGIGIPAQGRQFNVLNRSAVIAEAPNGSRSLPEANPDSGSALRVRAGAPGGAGGGRRRADVGGTPTKRQAPAAGNREAQSGVQPRPEATRGIPTYKHPEGIDQSALHDLTVRLRPKDPVNVSFRDAQEAVGYERKDVAPYIRRVGEVAALRTATEQDVENSLHKFVQFQKPEPDDPYADLIPLTKKEVDEAKAKAAAGLKKDFAEKKVAVRVKPAGLEGILRDGRMKQVTETKQSGGLGGASASYRAKRHRSEAVLFGIPEDAPGSDRPIYGYVAVDGIHPATSRDSNRLDDYGDIQVILKDSVRPRTTASVGDSMDDAVIPSPIDDPSWESFNGHAHLYGHGKQPEGADPYRMDYAAHRSILYPEAQVHGGVSLDDIEEVVFPDTPPAALAKKLDDAGVKYRVLRPSSDDKAATTEVKDVVPRKSVSTTPAAKATKAAPTKSATKATSRLAKLDQERADIPNPDSNADLKNRLANMTPEDVNKHLEDENVGLDALRQIADDLGIEHGPKPELRRAIADRLGAGSTSVAPALPTDVDKARARTERRELAKKADRVQRADGMAKLAEELERLSFATRDNDALFRESIAKELGRDFAGQGDRDMEAAGMRALVDALEGGLRPGESRRDFETRLRIKLSAAGIHIVGREGDRVTFDPRRYDTHEGVTFKAGQEAILDRPEISYTDPNGGGQVQLRKPRVRRTRNGDIAPAPSVSNDVGTAPAIGRVSVPSAPTAGVHNGTLTGDVGNSELGTIIPRDTPPEGIPVRNLTLRDQFSYTIEHGRAWRRNGVTYVAETGPRGQVSAGDQRALEQIRFERESLPVEADRFQRSYVLARQRDPNDAVMSRKYGIKDFRAYATTMLGDTIFWGRDERDPDNDPQLRPTVRHEFAHSVDHALGYGISDSEAWHEAGRKDATHRTRIRDFVQDTPGTRRVLLATPANGAHGGYPLGVTDYGTASSEEDLGDSIDLYLRGQLGVGRIGDGPIQPIYFRDIFPERAALLDRSFPSVAAKQHVEVMMQSVARGERGFAPRSRAQRLAQLDRARGVSPSASSVITEPDQDRRFPRRSRAARSKPGAEALERAIRGDLTSLIGRTKQPKQGASLRGGGRVASTRPLELRDGTPVIAQSYRINDVNGLSPEHQRDATYLSTLTAQAVGALAPRSYPKPDTMDPDAPSHVAESNVWMNRVPGKTALEYSQMDQRDLAHPLLRISHHVPRKSDDGTWRIRDITRGVDVRTGLKDSATADKIAEQLNELALDARGDAGDDDERLLGLLDLLIFNGDRHKGNWMIHTPEGRQPSEDDSIVGIDFGNAFHNMGSKRDIYDQFQMSTRTKAQWPGTDGWFSRPFLGPPDRTGYRHPERTANDMSPHDMEIIRRALEALQPEYARRGREDWWEDMMTRFEILAANAHGARDRLEG